MRRVILASLIAVGIGLFGAGMTSAERYTSPSYTIDASVGNSFGGSQSSTNYKLVSSGGESIIGSGSGGSYILGAGYVAQLDKSLQVTVQPSGLLAYYPMEESAGVSVYDESTNSLNGTINGSVSRTAGKVSQAVSFDGVSNRVSVPDNSLFEPSGDMTLEAWAKPATSSLSTQRIAAKYGTYFLAYDGSNKMRFNVNCSTLQTVTSTSTLATVGTWYHIVGVRTGNTLQIYINGVKEAESTVCSAANAASSSSFDIGDIATVSTPFNGMIDEVKLFSRALSAGEIKAEYDAGVAGNTAGLSFGGDIVSGVSQTSAAQAVVQTDAPGYTLMLNQNQNLTSGGNTIPSVTNSGTIGTPAAWTESTTKGLGFTLTSASATALPGKWGTNPNYAYAAVPGTSTSFYTRTGYTSGGKDALGIQYRVDVPSNQTAGNYTNVVTYTGVMTP